MRTWLGRLAVAGLLLGALLTGLGLLAPWWPSVDIVNDGLPFLILGALFVFGLACLARAPLLIAAAAMLAAVNILFGVLAMRGAAPDAPPGSELALRVLTFNLSHGNDRIGEVAKFLGESGADAVVLQEVSPRHGPRLLQALKPVYPFASGEAHIIVLSKHPILAESRVDRGPVFRNGTGCCCAGYVSKRTEAKSSWWACMSPARSTRRSRKRTSRPCWTSC
jgi:endonuclease/exonuclease/phosphatase (EEP) superfamily protein YafD